MVAENERRERERRCCPREEVFELRISTLEGGMSEIKRWLIGLVMLLVGNLAGIVAVFLRMGHG